LIRSLSHLRAMLFCSIKYHDLDSWKDPCKCRGISFFASRDVKTRGFDGETIDSILELVRLFVLGA
jgi:hypothetical protein